MREFKLRKWYPSLPEDWKNRTIVVVEREHGYELHPSLNTLTHDVLRFREVYNNDFWKEIKPMEYKILKFRYTDSGLENGVQYTELKPNGLYVNSTNPDAKGCFTLEQTLEQSHWKIYSVKRLSDGEVFTIGDSIDNTPFAKLVDRKIVSFDFDTSNTVTTTTGISKFESILPRIKSLFKTEDGVDVYKGYTVYQVSILDNKYSIHPTEARKEITPPPSYFKYFSTKETAEEYVLMNKKLISGNDLLEYLKEIGTKMDTLGDGFMDFLKRKAKL